MGHRDLNYADLLRLADAEGSGIVLTDRDRVFCDSCALAKARRNTVSTQAARLPLPLGSRGFPWHCDIVPMDSTVGMPSQRYGLFCMEESTHYIFLYFMPSKTDATRFLDTLVIDALATSAYGYTTWCNLSM
jgi:hypothetical protein